MIQLDPEDVIEIERVAAEYTAAFRKADAAAALALTMLPMSDCIDLGSRAGVYIMNEEDFTHSVLEHANEDFTTVTKSIVVEPLGKNAALARIEAVVTKPDGRTGETEWVDFLARTDNGWKIWANWLGPLPEGF